MTAVVVGLLARYAAGLPGPAAIVIGNGLALSSTAVVLQVDIPDVLYIFVKSWVLPLIPVFPVFLISL